MFTAWDWAVLAAYLIATTWLAEKLAGRRQTIRDFFLGGRKLPWWAVCGSIVASEISGVTFVSVPAGVFLAGGNYTYLMLAAGAIVARVIIGLWFVPAFYRREIYSPYEFMGQRLGPTVDRVATGVFFLGGFLAQGARLFLAALVLDAITNMGIPGAVLLLGGISVVWTWIGGINSVVWTDVTQFAILFLGAIAALVAVVVAVPGGVETIAEVGGAADKFRLWDFSLDPGREYTLWCGLFGTTFLMLGALGTDQGMAQRLFCCRNEREARRAIIASSVGILVAVIMLTVGVGIYVYYQTVKPAPAKVAERVDYLFPMFILDAMPVGVRGLLFASIFSAATATSTLSAMAQTGIASFFKPLFPHADEARTIRVSRMFVVLAAVGLCGVAVLCNSMKQYPDILRLALSMAAYTYGALLGMFLLALVPLGRDARGLIWGVPSSILFVFIMNWQQKAWAGWVAAAAVAPLVASAGWLLRREPLKILVVAAAGAAIMHFSFRDPPIVKLAFPWLFPIGTAVTFGMGWALGRRKETPPNVAERAAAEYNPANVEVKS